jgi:hypothetical protein
MNKSGFTLIEVLLYSALAVVIFSASYFYFNIILESRVSSQVTREVEGQGWQIAQKISQDLRNAININSPATSTSGSTLSFNTTAATTTPTIYTTSSLQMIVTRGSSTTVTLTNERVNVSDLQFSNLSRTGTHGNIRFQFTLTHVNPSGQEPYDYSRTFVGSASLR